ncbi:MAG: hypothetical protein ACFBSC_06640 [Microcoleaceae cyanobacterium]
MQGLEIQREIQIHRHQLLLNLLIALLLTYLPTLPAQAHGFKTTYLEIKETTPNHFDVLWKTPPNLMFGDEVFGDPITARPQFPDHCQRDQIPILLNTPENRLTRWKLDCGDQGLVGQSIGFPGLADVVEILLRIQWADGHSQTTMLPIGEDR